VARRVHNNFRATGDRWAHGGRGGFTLLELLVALFIGAILTVVMFESLNVANLARKSTERAIAPSRTAQIALDLLRSDLSNVPPVVSNTDSTKAATLATMFSGQQNSDDRGQEADILDFFTLGDAPLWPQSQSYLNAGGGLGSAVGGGGGGMGMNGGAQQYGTNGNWVPHSECKQIEITIDVPNGSNDHCLVRRVWHNVQTLNQNFDQTNPDQEEVICRGVESFTVQYFDGYEWLDSWDSTQSDNQLPVAVQITLEIDPPAGTTDRNAQPKRYVQVIQLPCSNAANDSNVNAGMSGF
jgi:prepilin-type N-terminal cleavage/methylation domain-containing protein